MTEKRKYWYKTFVNYCPVCGKETRVKVRQHTPKPEDINETIVWYDRYDWCDG